MLYNKNIAWIISELDKIFQMNWVVEKFAVSIEFVVRPDKSMESLQKHMKKVERKLKQKQKACSIQDILMLDKSWINSVEEFDINPTRCLERHRW